MVTTREQGQRGAPFMPAMLMPRVPSAASARGTRRGARRAVARSIVQRAGGGCSGDRDGDVIGGMER